MGKINFSIFLITLFIYLSKSITFNISCFSYGRDIVITNNKGSNFTDQDIKLEIDTQTLIEEGKMLSTCDDLTFRVPSNPDEYYQYWIESGCNTNKTVIWLRAPDIENGESFTIWMYTSCDNLFMETGKIEETPEYGFLTKGNCPGTKEDNDYFIKSGSQYLKESGKSHSHFYAAFLTTSCEYNEINAYSSDFDKSACRSCHQHMKMGETESLFPKDIYPPYKNVNFCWKEGLDLFNGSIIPFKSEESPGNFNEETAFNNNGYYPRIYDTDEIGGGSASHNHNFIGKTDGCDCDAQKFESGNNFALLSNDHEHSLSGKTNSTNNINNENIPPSFIAKFLVYQGGNQELTPEMIVFFKEIPPFGYNSLTETLDCFLRAGIDEEINTIIDGSSGYPSHSHDFGSFKVESSSDTINIRSRYWNSKTISSYHNHVIVSSGMANSEGKIPSMSVIFASRVDTSNISITYGDWEKVVSFNCDDNPCVKPQGNCTGPNSCTCLNGWGGSTCGTPLCEDDCINGTCVVGESDNHFCDCTEGYNGSACDNPICSDGCGNGECTSPGVCTCEDGYNVSTNCKEPICEGGCGYGECVSPGVCVCNKGYKNTSGCMEPICIPNCYMGECIFPENCSCELGWEGPRCTDAICDPPCKNGYCLEPKKCQCTPGYNGSSCESAICDPPCKNGECTSPNVCTCDTNYWKGSQCEEPVCSSCVHGNCSSPQNCTCQKGWTGDACSLAICDCKNGRCESPNECICFEKWSGPACDIAICDPPCKNGGNCTQPDNCDCDDTRWKGNDCADPVCSSCVEGECISPNNCSCNEGWKGSDCNKPICSVDCQNGNCEKPDYCDCNSGWDKINTGVMEVCTVPICDVIDCGENGECIAPNSCQCDSGWYGDNCTQLVSSNNGTAIGVVLGVTIPLVTVAILVCLGLIIVVSIITIAALKKKQNKAKTKALENMVADSVGTELELEEKKKEVESFMEEKLKNEEEKNVLKKQLERLKKDGEIRSKAIVEIEIADINSITFGKLIEYDLSKNIYLSNSKWNGKDVCVRELSEDFLNPSLDTLEILKKTFEDFGRVDHPNIVQFYAITPEPRICLISTKCELYSFKGLKKQRGMKFPTKIRILYELVLGLNALHKSGVRHGTLSFETIFFQRNYKPMIDYGFGKFLKKNRENDYFSSPEIILGMEKVLEDDEDDDDEEEDEEIYMRKEYKCDIYSFGILIFCLLTGDFDPFKMNGKEGVALRAANDANFRPTQITLKNKMGRYPNWWLNLQQQCTSHNPYDRPDTEKIASIIQNVLEQDEK